MYKPTDESTQISVQIWVPLKIGEKHWGKNKQPNNSELDYKRYPLAIVSY